jgi:hypothetical protein
VGSGVAENDAEAVHSEGELRIRDVFVCAVALFSGKSGEFKAKGGKWAESVLVVHQDQNIAGKARWMGCAPQVTK